MTKQDCADAIMDDRLVKKGIACQVSLPIITASVRREAPLTRRNPIETALAHPRVGLRPIGLGGS